MFADMGRTDGSTMVEEGIALDETVDEAARAGWAPEEIMVDEASATELPDAEEPPEAVEIATADEPGVVDTDEAASAVEDDAGEPVDWMTEDEALPADEEATSRRTGFAETSATRQAARTE
jgi:hypothetical protein